MIRQMIRRSRGLWVGGLLLSAVGCGGGLVGSPATGGAEMAELERRNVELRRQVTMSELEVARLREEIATLRRELEAARAPRPPRERTPRAVAEGPVAEPILGAPIEETELDDSEAPIAAQVTPPAAPTVAPTAAPPRPEPAAGPPPVAASDEALALYDESYIQFHEKRYAEAEAGFRRYLELYPETDLADNARFWIGESHYARSDYAAALEAFMATVELHPQGNKVADALLKAGKCLEALGRREEAKQTYHEITDRFPTSVAAAAARERLEELP